MGLISLLRLVMADVNQPAALKLSEHCTL